MNTISDILTFNRERASRHIAASDRGWWMTGIARAALFLLGTAAGWAAHAGQPSVHAITDVQETY